MPQFFPSLLQAVVIVLQCAFIMLVIIVFTNNCIIGVGKLFIVIYSCNRSEDAKRQKLGPAPAAASATASTASAASTASTSAEYSQVSSTTDSAAYSQGYGYNYNYQVFSFGVS